jgi:hypothetical protein
MAFKESLLIDIIQKEYQLEGSLSPLPGEVDLNYRLETSNGQKFVLKIAHAREQTISLADAKCSDGSLSTQKLTAGVACRSEK